MFSFFSKQKKDLRFDGRTRIWANIEGREILLQMEIMDEKISNKFQVFVNYSKFWEQDKSGKLIETELTEDVIDKLRNKIENEFSKDGFIVLH